MKETTNYYNNERPEIAFLIPSNIKTILDIGCGQGTFLKSIKGKTGADTWGIEIVNEAAEKAKDHIDNVLNGKVEDVLSLLPNSYFDCIVFNDVLEHLLEPTEVLIMIRPKLAKNGFIIASIPNVRYFNNLYELLIKKDWEYKDAGILDSTHLRFFTQISMKRMIENAGYKMIKQEGINKIASRKFLLLNFLTLGFFNDTKYLQFVCIASSKD
jgi:2-polyprenyl-3-methyl-5-hydroxy-6-metoxy-1,4-benzoquinol methylase